MEAEDGLQMVCSANQELVMVASWQSYLSLEKKEDIFGDLLVDEQQLKQS